MKNAIENSTYAVGFGKPPKNSQFQKGQSGNRRGRPRGALNLVTILERTLRQKVIVKQNGHSKEVTRLEAVVLQLANDATSGNSHAVRYLCQLVTSFEERPLVVEPAMRFSETDQEVVENFLKRFQQTLKEDGDEAKSE